MSDWYRGGRHEERRRYRFDSPTDRRGGASESRTFEHRHADYGQDWRGRQADLSDDGRDEDYGAEGYTSQGYGAQPYGGVGFGERRDLASGQTYPGQGFASDAWASHAYGGDRRGPSRSYEPRWYDEGRGYDQAYGHNDPLERVTDGEARPQMFGGHRGRGPKNYVRSDERIREDVNDRLSDDSWLDASDIEVAVSACEVTLTGNVANRQDRRRAEDLAERVSGVKHVQNNLRVQDGARQTERTDSEPQVGRTGLLS